MSASSRRAPSPLLLDPGYWRAKLAKMEGVQPGMILFPRPDLSGPLVDVVEWRMRAHDGVRIWGLRGSSPFHPQPKGARIREVAPADLPAIDVATVAEGQIDFVLQVPAGRRLEDRVLDLVRVYQAAQHLGVSPSEIHLVPRDTSQCPDEFLIAAGLLERGLC